MAIRDGRKRPNSPERCKMRAGVDLERARCDTPRARSRRRVGACAPFARGRGGAFASEPLTSGARAGVSPLGRCKIFFQQPSARVSYGQTVRTQIANRLAPPRTSRGARRDCSSVFQATRAVRAGDITHFASKRARLPRSVCNRGAKAASFSRANARTRATRTMARARERSARGGVRAVGSALASVVFFTGVLLVRVTAEEAGPGSPRPARSTATRRSRRSPTTRSTTTRRPRPPAFAGPSGERGARDAASRLGDPADPLTEASDGEVAPRRRPQPPRDAGEGTRAPARGGVGGDGVGRARAQARVARGARRGRAPRLDRLGLDLDRPGTGMRRARIRPGTGLPGPGVDLEDLRSRLHGEVTTDFTWGGGELPRLGQDVATGERRERGRAASAPRRLGRRRRRRGRGRGRVVVVRVVRPRVCGRGDRVPHAVRAREDGGGVLNPPALNFTADTGRPASVGADAVLGREAVADARAVLLPRPVGWDPDWFEPYGDFFTSEYAGIYERDIPLIAAAGINTSAFTRSSIRTATRTFSTSANGTASARRPGTTSRTARRASSTIRRRWSRRRRRSRACCARRSTRGRRLDHR